MRDHRNCDGSEALISNFMASAKILIASDELFRAICAPKILSVSFSVDMSTPQGQPSEFGLTAHVKFHTFRLQAEK